MYEPDFRPAAAGGRDAASAVLELRIKAEARV